MKSGIRLALGLVCLVVSAQSAEARRRGFFIPGFGSRGETIDRVHDLPNVEAFRKDGEYLDVGYLNGQAGNAYVLYQGDRYRKLDDQDIAALTGVLGFDPTAKHRAQYAIDHADEIAEAEAERAHKDDRIARGLMIERRAGESSADYAARKSEFISKHRSSSSQEQSGQRVIDRSGDAKTSPFGSTALQILLLSLTLIFGRKWLFKTFRGFAGNGRRDPETTGPSSALSFEQRVAARLSELQGSGGAQAEIGAQSYAPPEPPRPGRSGFGRKSS